MAEEQVIIGVPVHNDFESFKAMIESLVISTNSFDKLIIIESASTDATAEYCDFLVTAHPKIEVIHTAKEGPLKAYNRLFAIAKERKCGLL
jgi:glycosyltransferase involved in cell wall biosynthesis